MEETLLVVTEGCDLSLWRGEIRVTSNVYGYNMVNRVSHGNKHIYVDKGG